MHNCEEFRERITEYIIDREEVSAKPEFQHDLLICSSCAEFYAQSREMIQALDGIDLTVSESQWWGIERRLQATLFHAQPEMPARGPIASFFELQKWVNRATTPFFLSAAALLVITIGLSRLAIPRIDWPTSLEPATAIFVEHSVPLDPVTVDFLEESELLLRNVMKIEPANAEDLAQARKAASAQLAELEQRKEAAAEVPPVVGVMETYETILRDLRNVDERSADEDISDIQKRIETNGLIANMKAFQPRVTKVSFGPQ
jgi:hypothetical protein